MKMSTNASYNFRRGSSAVCVTGPRRTVFGSQNAQVSRTFAHSGSIVNHKGGNIFVISHVGTLGWNRSTGVVLTNCGSKELLLNLDDRVIRGRNDQLPGLHHWKTIPPAKQCCASQIQW
jgi:hypothetical protein